MVRLDFPTTNNEAEYKALIDYFTKWIEAEALATITEKNVRSFMWKNIICRYDIPRVLISDNGKQFDNNAFRDFCSQLGFKNYYSSPTHPQANGQVEVTNQSLLKIIKTQFEGARVYGQKNYQVFYGHIGRRQGRLQGRHRFD